MVQEQIYPVSIEDQMRSAYLDYAMSVIVARALPDVRDGLKPVQRRILYAMHELNITHTGPYRKSARVVGEVLGKYHPHGDVAVYDAMVRMAQDFSMRYPLIEGQGNFGSVDNDPPAAMRYTEARLSAIASEMLTDLDKDTVDFRPNFDASLEEPVVLPARMPNLLANGSAGIAVGMATNIPPHNLVELCDAICYLVDNPEASLGELMQMIKGPDFPTGGILLGGEGLRTAYATGHGSITIRAQAHIEEASGGRRQIIVTQLPYQVNKAALVAHIAQLAHDKKIVGVGELRDESDRQGIRVVVELRRDAEPHKVLNALFRYTAMQQGFYINMLALVNGEPRVLGLKDILRHFIDFRFEVITRRSRFELKVARDKAHILEGLARALDEIDLVVSIIRSARDTEAAKNSLMERLNLSSVQAQAILDMQLRRLVRLEREKVMADYQATLAEITRLEEILSKPERVFALIKEDSLQIRKRFDSPRRTEIRAEEAPTFAEEDLIPHRQMLISLTQRGFVKRMPPATFRAQQRGGRGLRGLATREGDMVSLLLTADTHDNILFFTSHGRVFSLKCHQITEDNSRLGKGTALVNLFSLAQGERVTAASVVSTFMPNSYLVLATKKGKVKRLGIEQFMSLRSSGLIAIKLDPADEVVGADVAGIEDDIVLLTRQCKAIRFAVSDIRESRRTSGGVRGIRLSEEDEVVSLQTVQAGGLLLLVSSQGYGKLTPVGRYPRRSRAGSGVSTFRVTDKTGGLVAARMVSQYKSVVLISRLGIVNQIAMGTKDDQHSIAVQGRRTRGVRLMRLDSGDSVVAVATLE